MKFPNDFYSHMAEHNYVGIKGGLERPTFLEIWMVQVNGRVFARSWGKSVRSWFTIFQEAGVGAFQYGDQIIKVKGQKVPVDSDIHAQIDAAYIARFTEPHNLFYANAIAQPDYYDYTMEFTFDGQEA